MLKIENGKLNAIAKLVKAGNVVIFPTDTVYGFLADATNKEAVKRVFQIKQRSFKKLLPLFVKDIEMAKKIAYISKGQEKFLRKSWPGKVTVVLKRKKSSIKLYGVRQETIALRIPKFNPINFLLKELGVPLVGTSANIAGEPSSGKLKEVLKQFKGKQHQPNFAVDGGVLSGKLSKVVDITTRPYTILRAVI